MILILSNKYDISVDYVVRLLKKGKREFLRINTENLLGSDVLVTFPSMSFKIEKKGVDYNLVNQCGSVWFRRPGKPFEFSPETQRPNESVIAFAENQWHAFIEGLKSIRHLFWLNDPDRNHAAENKIVQLRLAQEVGLRIPRTCITTSKEEVMRFMNDCDGKIVAKALYLPLIEEKEKDYFIFTNVIDTIEDIPRSEFRLAPTIFQELLSEKKDYRLTIVGNECFSVEVVTESRKKGIATDWRIVKEGVRFQPCELPSDVVSRCANLVKRFGLVFGAIDLVQTPSGFYFLEINPNGEWAWLQKEAGLPIAETIVDILVQEDLEK